MVVRSNSPRHRRSLVVRLAKQELSNPAADNMLPGGLRLHAGDGSRPTPDMAEFSRQCGAPAGIVLTLIDPATGVVAGEVDLEQPFALIGGDDHCDIQLPGLPPLTLYVHFLGQRVYLCPLNYSDKIEAQWIDSGEIFAVGPWHATVRPATCDGHDVVIDDAEPEPGVWPDGQPVEWDATDEDLLAPAVLEFRSPSGQLRRWNARRAISLIGSGAQCRIQFASRTVALCHASMVRTRQGIWIIALASSVETRIDETAVTVSPVLDHQSVQIGRFVIGVALGLHASQFKPEQAPAVSTSVTPTKPAPPLVAAVPESAWEESIAAVLEQAPVEQESPAIEAEVVPEMPVDSAIAPAASTVADSRNLHLSQHNAGLSEQFVLEMMQTMQSMQRQTLDHAQRVMSDVMDVFQQRINQLESQNADIMRTLTNRQPTVPALPAPAVATVPPAPPVAAKPDPPVPVPVPERRPTAEEVRQRMQAYQELFGANQSLAGKVMSAIGLK